MLVSLWVSLGFAMFQGAPNVPPFFPGDQGETLFQENRYQSFQKEAIEDLQNPDSLGHQEDQKDQKDQEYSEEQDLQYPEPTKRDFYGEEEKIPTLQTKIPTLQTLVNLSSGSTAASTLPLEEQNGKKISSSLRKLPQALNIEKKIKKSLSFAKKPAIKQYTVDPGNTVKPGTTKRYIKESQRRGAQRRNNPKKLIKKAQELIKKARKGTDNEYLENLSSANTSAMQAYFISTHQKFRNQVLKFVKKNIKLWEKQIIFLECFLNKNKSSLQSLKNTLQTIIQK